MALHPVASPTTDELPVVLAQLAQASAEILVLDERNRQLQGENDWFRELYKLHTSKLFGPSSEATPQELQLVFNEVEAQADASAPEPTLGQVVQRVYRTKGKRDAQLANLPVEEVRHELAEDQRHCPRCSSQMDEMGSEVSRELKIIPAKAVVVEHHRCKYFCRNCDQHGTAKSFAAAPTRPQAFPNSLASPSMVAYIASQKYEMGSPLYRLEAHFNSMDLELPRQNMANWLMRGGDVLSPLYGLLHRELVSRDICHADETTLQVLREVGREATSKSYMWTYCTGRQDPPVVLFDYSTTRAYEHAHAFLKDFKGFLHADGYGCYDTLPGVTVAGCLAHARRGFEEARKVLPKPDQKKMNPPNQGLDFCNRLFRIEREAHDLTVDERFAMRDVHSRKVLEEFHSWLLDQAIKVTPKSKLGQAIGYCLNQWPKLNNFLLDGRLEIDNNRCERAVKPFAIGRKNWLFANTPRGARTSAIMYSIVETAKANDLVPREYLTHLFERIPLMKEPDPQALADLLPWAPGVRARCAVSTFNHS
jgi:transposase